MRQQKNDTTARSKNGRYHVFATDDVVTGGCRAGLGQEHNFQNLQLLAWTVAGNVTDRLILASDDAMCLKPLLQHILLCVRHHG
jgi:hypothetical protein